MSRMPLSSLSTTAADLRVAASGEGDPIRLLLLTDTPVLVAGGSERFLRNLVRRLPAERYHITIVQLTEQTPPEDSVGSLQDLANVSLRSIPVDAVYARRGWAALRTLRRMLRQEGYDVVQSQHDKSDLLNALLPAAKGRVRISNRRDMGFNKTARMRAASRLLNRRYDCVVAPAQPILVKLAESENLPAQNTLCIPNGVDTERFRPLPEPERSAARRELGLEQDAIAFACLASLTPVKRHVDLVQAFAQVHAQLPNARLLLVGDGPLRGAIEAQIDALGLRGAVRLLGNLADVGAVLGALDISVLASSTEGMSNAILESMACGLPSVVTRVGGNIYLVEEDVSGLLVPALQPQALADAMLGLARAPELRARYGAAARQKMEREYSLDAMAGAFDQLYRRLLKRPS